MGKVNGSVCSLRKVKYWDFRTRTWIRGADFQSARVDFRENGKTFWQTDKEYFILREPPRNLS
jgi:hypothetical protein